MLSLSSLIEFLLDMLRDEATKAEFERDPSGTLAARGLSGVTAQDVRDVEPILADVGGVERVAHDGGHAQVRVAHDGGHAHVRTAYDGGRSGGEAHDVVREVHHMTTQYVARPQVTEVTQEYKTYNSYSEFHSTDNSVHAEDGGTVTIIRDSFNQDNDGVDNKGGTIDGSTVGGGNVTGSGNTTEQTVIEDSFGETHETVVEDSYDVGPEGDEGDDDAGQTSVADVPDGDGSSGGGSFGGASFGGGTVNDSYDVHGPATSAASADLDEPVGAENG